MPSYDHLPTLKRLRSVWGLGFSPVAPSETARGFCSLLVRLQEGMHQSAAGSKARCLVVALRCWAEDSDHKVSTSVFQGKTRRGFPENVNPLLSFLLMSKTGAKKDKAGTLKEQSRHLKEEKAENGQNSGKEKTHKHKQIPGLSRDWVGAKILFMCFVRVFPYGGRKST